MKIKISFIFNSLIWIFAILICFTACKKKHPKPAFTLNTPGGEVVALHNDSTPQVIFYYKTDTKGNPTSEKIGVAEFYPNKQERISGGLKQEKREGKWYAFFQDGSVQTEAFYIDGKEHGDYTVYQENGKPLIKQHYNYGACDGTWIWYDINGKETKRVVADKNTIVCEYCPKCLKLKQK